MSIDDLRRYLDDASRAGRDAREWIDALDERKLEELRYHDEQRGRQVAASGNERGYAEQYSSRKFYRTVGESSAYTRDWVARNARGRVFLDYACGRGNNAITAAGMGAALSIGVDISSESIEAARAAASGRGLSNTYFVQADAENTGLPESSVDAVVCSGVLHHLDLGSALSELNRVLAPGGRILVIEPLNYNPLIRAFRSMTPENRTEWERTHILSLRDIDSARRYFRVGQMRFWHVTSYAAAFIPPMLPFLNRLDRLLTSIPGVRLMAWIVTIELVSKKQVTV